MATVTAPPTPAHRPRISGRALWRASLLVLLILVVVFHLAGGWYFSSELNRDAFEVRPWEPDFDISVQSVEGDTVVLAGEDPDLANPVVLGLDYPEGYGQVSEVLSTGAETTRRFQLLSGQPPRPGTLADLQGFAFPDDPATALGIDYTTVTYPSPLGPMEAWLVPAASSTWVVHVHGKGAPLAESLRLLRPLHRAGYTQLVISYRNDPGQPQDPSGRYQYGVTEWEDLAAAVEWAEAQGASQVVLVGYSTGAAISLAYMYRGASGDMVAGGVFDSPNIDFSATVDHNRAQRRLPVVPLPIPATLGEVAKFFTALRLDVNWRTLDYVSRADRLRVPVLVIHGSDDATVPLSGSQRLAAARPDLVRLVVVEGAGHVLSWNTDPTAYEAEVVDFVDQIAAP